MRPLKNTVDYFPHDTTQRRTIFILKNKFGLIGYGFWYSILEILGQTHGHAYDCTRQEHRDYIEAYTMLEWSECKKILDKLAELDAIDRALWEENNIIWSDNFVLRLNELYRKRREQQPVKPDIRVVIDAGNSECLAGNPAKESKGKERREEKKELSSPPEKPAAMLVSFETFWKAYPIKSGKKKAFEKWKKLKPTPKLLQTILAAIDAQLKWRRNAHGQFRPEWPHPTTWLNGERWNDNLSGGGGGDRASPERFDVYVCSCGQFWSKKRLNSSSCECGLTAVLKAYDRAGIEELKKQKAALCTTG
jgi:hypothetical protein